MSIKDHPFIIIGSLVVAAFVAGWFAFAAVKSVGQEETEKLATELKAVKEQQEKLEDLFSLPGARGAPAVARGAVVAFNLHECPDGWGDFALAQGRFVLGVGGGETILETGGDRTAMLSEANLPEHRHSVHGTNHRATPANADNVGLEYGQYLADFTTTGAAGHAAPAPIGIMPPYVPLRYCERK